VKSWVFAGFSGLLKSVSNGNARLESPESSKVTWKSQTFRKNNVGKKTCEKIWVVQRKRNQTLSRLHAENPMREYEKKNGHSSSKPSTSKTLDYRKM
jgi:dephospho-CoA kinase